MMRYVCASLAATLLATLGLGSLYAHCAATPETEVREFNIEIENKPAGQYLMTMTKQENGVLSMRAQASISYKFLVVTYTYSYRGDEHWKDGRLIQLRSTCNDDGKKSEVSGDALKDSLQLTVTVNGNSQKRHCPWDVVTTTYWMQPDQRFHNQRVPLLDADSGREYPQAQLKYVGKEQLVIMGRQQECNHFRVTGGPTTPCDLWYDGQQRLVRQEFPESGKRVVFSLAAIRR